MNVVKFRVSGVLNSFRVPFFVNFHKTLLAPPKSTIIGMLCNIALKSNKEFYSILKDEMLKVGIIIENISGVTKDLWKYKTFKPGSKSSIVRREKLFNVLYQIYIKTDNKTLLNEFYTALKEPKNTPSLGLDDEMVKISDVVKLNALKTTKSKKLHSVFADIDEKFIFIDAGKTQISPIKYPLYTAFEAFDNKGKRVKKLEIEKSKKIVCEYYGYEIEFQNEIECFSDGGKNLVFY